VITFCGGNVKTYRNVTILVLLVLVAIAAHISDDTAFAAAVSPTPTVSGGGSGPIQTGVDFCNTLFAPNIPIDAHYDGWLVFGQTYLDQHVPHKVGLGLGQQPIYDRDLILSQGGIQLVVRLLPTQYQGRIDWTLVKGQAVHCPVGQQP
jgi:hypothetical protein